MRVPRTKKVASCALCSGVRFSKRAVVIWLSTRYPQETMIPYLPYIGAIQDIDHAMECSHTYYVLERGAAAGRLQS